MSLGCLDHFLPGRSRHFAIVEVICATFCTQPLQVANQPNSWDIALTTNGGGVTGQVGAARLAIARALLKNDPELRAAFREEGLLTRDARKKERKKAGQPGARKRFQFSKR